MFLRQLSSFFNDSSVVVHLSNNSLKDISKTLSNHRFDKSAQNTFDCSIGLWDIVHLYVSRKINGNPIRRKFIS